MEKHLRGWKRHEGRAQGTGPFPAVPSWNHFSSANEGSPGWISSAPTVQLEARVSLQAH